MTPERPTLRLVPMVPFGYFPPWCCRPFTDDHDYYASCCFCGRSVCVPKAAFKKNVACVFCGWESGAVPEMEVEP